MLTTLIYRSMAVPRLQREGLISLVQDALRKNTENNITGILLFSGDAFFQVLEGEEMAINRLFNQIRVDSRHRDIVLLMQDYSAYRRFMTTGMRLFEAGNNRTASILNDIQALSHFRGNYLQDDRIIRLITAFLQQHKYTRPAEYRTDSWHLKSRPLFMSTQRSILDQNLPYQFAFQPIVEAITGHISSYEALLRNPSGGTPESVFDSVPADQLHHFDLETKALAFTLGSQFLKDNERLSVNLLPGVLESIPDATERLIKHIKAAGLRPEQVIIEVTEAEAVTNPNAFYQALKALRVAGTGLAIDDFGAGYAGLALLTRFQPDKIKIDRALIEGIHLSGVKQAIVRSVARCCEELGISVVAEGVETLEEWYWLESVGIHLFQGFMFSRPCLNTPGHIQWPSQ